MSDRLYKIVSKVFDVDVSKINDDTNPENLEEWDSFNFYVLLDEIENEFNIKFDLDETLEIKKIGDFKKMFEKFTKQANKKQYLIPYFIAAHPGCTDEDMLNLSLWLKNNDFRVDQVQTFYPSPMALATAMYHSG